MPNTKREKGATEFDKLCHKLYDAGAESCKTSACGVTCLCGHELETYYCEERLFLVVCHACKTTALVKAGSPREAAFKSFAGVSRRVVDTYSE